MKLVDMDVESLRELLASARMKLKAQSTMCDNVDSWTKPDLAAGFDVPRRASAEHRALQRLSRTPWLGLVVTTAAQAMYVSGFTSEDSDAKRLNRLWADNGMESLQIANHRAMLGYGDSFGVVTPAELRGVDSARMRCLSPRRMWADWEDPATDPHPLLAVESLGIHGGVKRWRIYDTMSIVMMEGDAEKEVVTEIIDHNLGVTPVVRFPNQMDLEGASVGEVAPLIPSSARINKTSYDRLLAQHFSSWSVKTISGIDLPEETEDPEADARAVEEQKLKLAQEDMLTSEDPDTKFGSLPATPLDPFVNSWRSDIEALAAVSQTPTYALTGQLVNLGTEALASARAGLTQKIFERQTTSGVAYSRMQRLGASLCGWDDLAADPLVRATWRDMEIRSLSQAVDALGKARQMLDVPARALWSMIPGVEAHQLAMWERMADEDAAADPVASMLRRHSAPMDGEDVVPLPGSAA